MKITLEQNSEVFMIECSVNDSCDKVTTDAANLHNLRLRVKRLAAGVSELIKYGPMKPPDQHGLSEEQINAGGDKMKQVEGADPLGMRVGKACDEVVAKTLEKCAADAEMAVSNEHAKRRNALDIAKINECLMNVKGAVMMAYPMGLPEWDSVRAALEDNEDLAGQEASKFVLDAEKCVMWFAGKQMNREDPISKYCGKNEKCMVKCKMTNKGGNAPQRPPAVDEDTQKKMMAYWHKKQAQEKDLAEAEEDSYLNSEWANPKGYKNAMNGLGSVRLR